MKAYVLKRVGDIYNIGDEVTHYAGSPYDGPETQSDIQRARVFKTLSGAKASNEYRHWGYTTIVEVETKIEIVKEIFNV